MRSDRAKLLFFTAATQHYVPFLPIYVYFAFKSNPGAVFEFIVDDVEKVEADYAPSLAFLRKVLGARVLLRDDCGQRKKVRMDNTLRFILPPIEQTEFVYIGDVDIMVVEDVMQHHQRVFDQGLPYSNIIRNGKRKLTGLHFTRHDSYYPLPKVDDILANHENDEDILYQIVKRKGQLDHQPAIDKCGAGRPQHGIHMSLNRIPFIGLDIGVSWGVSWALIEQTHSVISEEGFMDFVALLPHSSRMFLANLFFIVEGAMPLGREKFAEFVKPDPKGKEPEVFTEIYRKNLWKGKESTSGPSSNMARTENLRHALRKLVTQYEIKRFLDAPCGDFFWMQSLAPELPIEYIGADLVDTLVAENRSKYQFDNVKFTKLDLRRDPLPASDLLFCRDCLFHLSYADIALVLKNFLASECRYLMTTSHINKKGFKNTDIKTGAWRWFDLFLAPFEFPQNHIESVLDGGGDRHMYLWRKEDLVPAIEAFIARIS